MHKIIFGNFVNQLMTEVPGPAHVAALTAPSPRKIWYANEGDMIVIPRAMDDFYKRYACRVIGIDPERVEVLCPSGDLGSYLAVRISDDDGARKKLQAFRQKFADAQAEVFALDQVTVEFLRDLAIPLYPYGGFPPARALTIVSRINTKSGFKEIAAQLDIRTVPGMTVVGLPEAQTCARELFQKYGPLVMKIDRGSNGYGHVIIDREEDIDGISQAIAKFSEQPDKYTIEKRMSFSSLPSIEHFIDNDGPSKTYDCSMRCVNNAWTGMITPANDLPESVSGPMNRWGTDLSALLYREGYRGTVDIDCGVTSDGTIYATESNCRKTGGSYLHSLLTRLKGADYARTTTWLADSRVGRSDLSFEEGIGALERAGISWSPVRGDGVILTADTRSIDRKWRYLIIGRSASHALESESRLLAVLDA